MKKFFTLKSIMLAFLLSIIVYNSAYADEYKSIIRYDRVWEHIWSHWWNTRANYAKFNGVEEINGKTYHQLVTFKMAGYASDDEQQPYLLDSGETCFIHEGYVREEDGKVYTLVLNIYPDNEEHISEFLRWTPKSEELPYVEERLLYDFTRKEGESFCGLHISAQARDMVYKVKSIEYIEIEVKQHLLQRVSPEEYDYIELAMVEGIGIDSEYGCLTTINFLDLPTCPCYDHIFNRVLSLDGDMIYGSQEGYDKVPIGDLMGVHKITDSEIDDTPIYDALGRRISTPAPGQLYIQDGKKLIAPKP